MPPPSEISESNRVWLGKYSDDEADGYLRTVGTVYPSELAIFERRFTIGSPNAESDEYLSSLNIDDLSGGGQIEDSAEQTDVSRFHGSVLDTRSPHTFTLPPLVTLASTPSTATDCYPLGDDIELGDFIFYQDGSMIQNEETVTETELETVTGDLSATVETFTHSITAGTVLRVTNSLGSSCPITLHYTTGSWSATFLDNYAPGLGFLSPWGAAVDSAGNIYVTCQGDDKVRKYTKDGAFLFNFGGSGTGNGKFNNPTGVAVDGDGNVYVVDSLNHRVQKFNSSGVYQSQFGSVGTGNGQFFSPTGIAVAPNGTIYVVDTGVDRVQYFTSSGTYSGQFGSSGTDDGEFSFPIAIAIAGNGNVYVSDSAGTRVQAFSSTGTYSAKFGSSGTGNGEFVSPSGIAIDGAGNIYVADSSREIVQVFSSAHSYVGQFGTPNAGGEIGDGELDSPAGVVCVPGRVFVINNVNGSISAWTNHTGAYAFDPNGDQTAGAAITLTRWDIRSSVSTSRTVAVAKRVTGFSPTPTTTDEPLGKGLAWYINGVADFLVPGVDAEFDTGWGVVQDYETFDNTVYALTVNGYLLKYDQFADTPDWVKVQDQTGSFDVRLNETHTPRRLVKWFNKNGDETLFVVSDRALFQFNNITGSLNATPVHVARGANFGQGVDVWRTGEDLHISWGDDTIRFTGAGVIIPLSGLARDDGLHPRHAGTICDLQSELSALYALTTPVSGARPALHTYTGQGWHTVWEGDVDADPTWMATSQVGGVSRLYWGMETGALYSITFPAGIHNPRQGFKAGVSQFAASGWLETSRYDMAMLGFRKKASHVVVTMDNATATETVTIKYRTEANPSSWLTLGEITGAGQTYLYFDPDGDGKAEGLAFEWIQFRWEFARGSDSSQTPIMRAFTFHFRKLPQQARSFTITVALPKDEDVAGSALTLRDRLNDLLVADEYLCLVHQDQQYRGDLTSVTGTDGTGEEHEGQRVLTFVHLPERTGSAQEA